MEQPYGFEQGDHSQNLVCKLTKALYGLKQAPRAWYFKPKQVLQKLGFIFSQADNSLFSRKTKDSYIIILVYVDDTLITGNNDKDISHIIKLLDDSFSLKDLGLIHQFLGIQVTHFNNGLHLCQHQYIKDLLSKVNMASAKGSITTMVSSPHLSKSIGDSVADNTLYRSVIGGLQYITITRPGIVYSVNKPSQFMQHPLDTHWKTVKRVLRYLAATPTFGLFIMKTPTLQITGYSDSDWATNIDDRKFITGFCVYLGDNLVSWCSKKQEAVSRSNTEAEYKSLAHCATEVMWLRNLLTKLHIPIVKTPIIWTDNIGAEVLASNPIFYSRIKYVELDVHFIREKVSQGLITVQHVPSIDQTADVLTKPLSKQSFTRFRSRLKVFPSPRTD
ncbi:hypothetical protein DH2020_002183 [Rehmannia glutinosa]|uniref:Reverse transcriptase Ty1/copia-type domain-containing protein n=1 Tax=Rehmannia glutinosa TaxID=99300 RepID=A0ABR0XSY7_REHGL